MLTASRRIKMTNALRGLTELLGTDPLCTSKQTLSTFLLASLSRDL